MTSVPDVRTVSNEVGQLISAAADDLGAKKDAQLEWNADVRASAFLMDKFQVLDALTLTQIRFSVNVATSSASVALGRGPLLNARLGSRVNFLGCDFEVLGSIRGLPVSHQTGASVTPMVIQLQMTTELDFDTPKLEAVLQKLKTDSNLPLTSSDVDQQIGKQLADGLSSSGSNSALTAKIRLQMGKLAKASGLCRLDLIEATLHLDEPSGCSLTSWLKVYKASMKVQFARGRMTDVWTLGIDAALDVELGPPLDPLNFVMDARFTSTTNAKIADFSLRAVRTSQTPFGVFIDNLKGVPVGSTDAHKIDRKSSMDLLTASLPTEIHAWKDALSSPGFQFDAALRLSLKSADIASKSASWKLEQLIVYVTLHDYAWRILDKLTIENCRFYLNYQRSRYLIQAQLTLLDSVFLVELKNLTAKQFQLSARLVRGTQLSIGDVARFDVFCGTKVNDAYQFAATHNIAGADKQLDVSRWISSNDRTNDLRLAAIIDSVGNVRELSQLRIQAQAHWTMDLSGDGYLTANGGGLILLVAKPSGADASRKMDGIAYANFTIKLSSSTSQDLIGYVRLQGTKGIKVWTLGMEIFGSPVRVQDLLSAKQLGQTENIPGFATIPSDFLPADAASLQSTLLNPADINLDDPTTVDIACSRAQLLLTYENTTNSSNVVQGSLKSLYVAIHRKTLTIGRTFSIENLKSQTKSISMDQLFMVLKVDIPRLSTGSKLFYGIIGGQFVLNVGSNEYRVQARAILSNLLPRGTSITFELSAAMPTTTPENPDANSDLNSLFSLDGITDQQTDSEPLLGLKPYDIASSTNFLGGSVDSLTDVASQLLPDGYPVTWQTLKTSSTARAWFSIAKLPTMSRSLMDWKCSGFGFSLDVSDNWEVAPVGTSSKLYMRKAGLRATFQPTVNTVHASLTMYGQFVISSDVKNPAADKLQLDGEATYNKNGESRTLAATLTASDVGQTLRAFFGESATDKLSLPASSPSPDPKLKVTGSVRLVFESQGTSSWRLSWIGCEILCSDWQLASLKLEKVKLSLYLEADSSSSDNLYLKLRKRSYRFSAAISIGGLYAEVLLDSDDSVGGNALNMCITGAYAEDMSITRVKDANEISTTIANDKFTFAVPITTLVSGITGRGMQTFSTPNDGENTIKSVPGLDDWTTRSLCAAVRMRFFRAESSSVYKFSRLQVRIHGQKNWIVLSSITLTNFYFESQFLDKSSGDPHVTNLKSDTYVLHGQTFIFQRPPPTTPTTDVVKGEYYAGFGNKTLSRVGIECSDWCTAKDIMYILSDRRYILPDRWNIPLFKKIDIEIDFDPEKDVLNSSALAFKAVTAMSDDQDIWNIGPYLKQPVASLLLRQPTLVIHHRRSNAGPETWEYGDKHEITGIYKLADKNIPVTFDLMTGEFSINGRPNDSKGRTAAAKDIGLILRLSGAALLTLAGTIFILITGLYESAATPAEVATGLSDAAGGNPSEQTIEDEITETKLGDNIKNAVVKVAKGLRQRLQRGNIDSVELEMTNRDTNQSIQADAYRPSGGGGTTLLRSKLVYTGVLSPLISMIADPAMGLTGNDPITEYFPMGVSADGKDFVFSYMRPYVDRYTITFEFVGVVDRTPIQIGDPMSIENAADGTPTPPKPAPGPDRHPRPKLLPPNPVPVNVGRVLGLAKDDQTSDFFQECRVPVSGLQVFASLFPFLKPDAVNIGVAEVNSQGQPLAMDRSKLAVSVNASPMKDVKAQYYSFRLPSATTAVLSAAVDIPGSADPSIAVQYDGKLRTDLAWNEDRRPDLIFKPAYYAGEALDGLIIFGVNTSGFEPALEIKEPGFEFGYDVTKGFTEFLKTMTIDGSMTDAQLQPIIQNMVIRANGLIIRLPNTLQLGLHRINFKGIHAMPATEVSFYILERGKQKADALASWVSGSAVCSGKTGENGRVDAQVFDSSGIPVLDTVKVELSVTTYLPVAPYIQQEKVSLVQDTTNKFRYSATTKRPAGQFDAQVTVEGFSVSAVPWTILPPLPQVQSPPSSSVTSGLEYVDLTRSHFNVSNWTPKANEVMSGWIALVDTNGTRRRESTCLITHRVALEFRYINNAAQNQVLVLGEQIRPDGVFTFENYALRSVGDVQVVVKLEPRSSTSSVSPLVGIVREGIMKVVT